MRSDDIARVLRVLADLSGDDTRKTCPDVAKGKVIEQYFGGNIATARQCSYATGISRDTITSHCARAVRRGAMIVLYSKPEPETGRKAKWYTANPALIKMAGENSRLRKACQLAFHFEDEPGDSRTSGRTSTKEGGHGDEAEV